MPRPASSATPSSFRDWRYAAGAAGTTYSATAAAEEAGPAAAVPATVPLVVLFPLAEQQQQGEEAFSSSRYAVRADGMGGLTEFFVPGSPTFVRTAQPALLVLSTLGGLAVLGALLTV